MTIPSEDPIFFYVSESICSQANNIFEICDIKEYWIFRHTSQDFWTEVSFFSPRIYQVHCSVMHYYKCNKNATIRNQSFNNKIIFNNERIYYYSLTCPATLNPPFCRIVSKGWMWCYWLWNVEKLCNDWYWDRSQRQSEYSIPSLYSLQLNKLSLV